MLKEFSALDPKSKVFIFQSEEILTDQQIDKANDFIRLFINNWQSHGQDIKASFSIKYHKFIIVAIDSSYNQASGCSIDKLTHMIQELGVTLNTNLMNRDSVFLDDKDDIKAVKLNQLKSKIESGELTENTLVFNPLISSINDLKTNWVIALHKSWMSKYLIQKVF